MEKSKESAFGFVGTFKSPNGNEHVYSHGLTKREYFAGLAMQGMLANQHTGSVQNGNRIIDPKCLSINSVIFADALLEELSKK